MSYLNKYIDEDSYISDDEQIAHDYINEIIAAYESDLVELNICVIFRDHHLKKGGATKWASVEKPLSLLRFFASQYYQMYVDVLLQIDYVIWQRLDDMQRKALIHHELRHIRIEWDEKNDDYKRNHFTGRLEFSLVVHDKEEFKKIEDLYGSDWADQIRDEE